MTSATDRPLLRVVTAAYPSPARPRRARFIEDFHRALLPYFDSEILAPRVHPEDPLEEERYGVRVRRFDYGARGQAPRERPLGPWRLVRYAIAAERAARSCWPTTSAGRAGFVLAHWVLPSGWVARRAARRLDRPLVLYGHGTDLHTLARRPLWARLAGSLLTAADQRVVVSRALARIVGDLASIDVDDVPVVPMAVGDSFVRGRDRAAARFDGSSNEDDSTPLRVLYVGDFVRGKGVDLLIESVRRLRAERVAIDLHALGSGPLGSRLEALGAGRVEEADEAGVAAAMREADVLALPSWNEGCPLVVQEAFALDLPVVASPVGGIPELARARPGWIPVWRPTVDAWSERLRFLAQERDALMTLRRKMIDSPPFEPTWAARLPRLLPTWSRLARGGRE